MKNVKIKNGALIGYGIAIEGEDFDAFGNPTKNSRPLLMEQYLDISLLEVKERASYLAGSKNKFGAPSSGRVVVVELRAIEEVSQEQESECFNSCGKCSKCLNGSIDF